MVSTNTELERIIWGNTVTCPYEGCGSNRITRFEGYRFVCNNCASKFSPTSFTFMHKTHIDLEHWKYAIKNPNLTVRELAYVLQINKNTAQFMKERIDWGWQNQAWLVERIRQS